MSIADLLRQSRAAHLRYRQAAGHIDTLGGVRTTPDNDAARLAIVDALELRNEAETQDPHHDDPAWSADTAANHGVPSVKMLQFYRNFFTS